MNAEATLDTLRDFIRAGGAPSLAEWLSLSEECRAVLLAEAEVLRIENAVRIGTSAHGPAAAAEILAAIDGGALSRRMALRASAGRILEDEKARQKPLTPADVGAGRGKR